MEEAYGRRVTTEGQGGSIPLCNVLAETYPDAEIMLLGVEEPKCLIHAPNESVDPSEIEHIALAEALFLERYAEARAMTPAPFTAAGLRARMERAAEQAGGGRPDRRARHARPGSRLLHGLHADGDHRAADDAGRSSRAATPAMILPILERPDAEAAPSAGTVALTDWTDGNDPYAAAAPLLEPDGRYAISDSAWAMHLLGLQAALPGTRYVSMTSALPMLRAIKDADEIERLAAAGAAADDASLEEIVQVRFAGRTENEVAADLAALLREHGHSQVDFTVVGSGPNGANPHHEAGERTIEEGDMVVLDFGGLKDGYGSDTTRTVHVGEPTDEEREVYEIVRARPAGRLRGRAAGRRLPGDRPRRAQGDHRRRLRRVLHPPRRATGSGSRPTSRPTWSRARST